MATRIEHRATFAHGTADVFASQTDPEALRARLAEIGGKDSELRDYKSDAGGVRYTLLQGVAAEQLPQLVRTIHKGDLTVRREHTWTPAGERYTGTVAVHVSSMPGQITARSELVPEKAGSMLITRGEVTVWIPLIGGKLESFVVGEITGLLEREAAFSATWLNHHR